MGYMYMLLLDIFNRKFHGKSSFTNRYKYTHV